MIEKLQKFVQSLEFGEGIRAGDLYLRPILLNRDKAESAKEEEETAKAESVKDETLNSEIEPPLLTLREAYSKRLITIRELSTGATVPEIEIKNKSDKEVFILSGEVVRGARQDRAFNSNIVVKPGETIKAPVSCVEQGRWRVNSPEFVPSGGVVPPSIKRELFVPDDWAPDGYRRRSSQTEVWNLIDKKLRGLGVLSPTKSYPDSFGKAEEFLSSCEIQRAMHAAPNQVGILAFIRDGFAGLEVFSTPGLFSKQCRKILTGYALDALDKGVSFPQVNVVDELRNLKPTRVARLRSNGAGQEFCFETESLLGNYCIKDGDVLYCNIFPHDEMDRGGSEFEPTLFPFFM